jgi:hypothetical protein
MESVAETPVSGAVIVGVYMCKSIQSAPEKKTESGLTPEFVQLDRIFLFSLFAIVIMCTPSPHGVLARKKEGMRETMQK